MKPNLKIIITFISLVISIFSYTFLLPTFKSEAAPLTASYLYLSRIAKAIDGSAATVEYVFAFKASQSFDSGGTVKLIFPLSEDTEWCRTAGALTVAGVTASAADSTADWDIDSALPGTLTAACAQGNGTTTYDTITISGVGALDSTDTYGVKISNDAGAIGTATNSGAKVINVEVQKDATLDSATFQIYIVDDDQVVVSATVESIPTVTCSLSTNTINLGSLYPGGAYTTNSTLQIETSATIGYYWAVYGYGDNSTDAGLYKDTATTHLIPSTGSTNLDLATAAHGFGMKATQPSGATVPADFSSATASVFGALDRLPSGARLFLYKATSATSETSTISFGAKAGSSAPAGSYEETLTYVCGGYY